VSFIYVTTIWTVIIISKTAESICRFSPNTKLRTSATVSLIQSQAISNWFNAWVKNSGYIFAEKHSFRFGFRPRCKCIENLTHYCCQSSTRADSAVWYVCTKKTITFWPGAVSAPFALKIGWSTCVFWEAVYVYLFTLVKMAPEKA